MPELPDVEVFRQYLDATSLHQEIGEAEVRDRRLLEDVTADALEAALEGSSLEETRRHGKHLFVRPSGGRWLRLHFGMTGELEYRKASSSRPPEHTALMLRFENGYRLAYVNMRRLGHIGLVEEPDAFIREKGLGPDALDPELGPDGFRELLQGRRGTIKGALMDQSLLAGVGNVYADEALFRARIHPASTVSELDAGALGRLHGALLGVLRSAIRARVEADRFPDSFLLPDREDGAPCPHCGSPLEKIAVSGRPTYLCPEEQARPA